MTTERKAGAAKKAGAKKVAAKKAPAAAAKATTTEARLRRARAFALEHNFGLSSRVREMLDSHQAELKILMDESLPTSKIQLYIQQNFGPKVGAKALAAYLEKTFPAAAKAAAGIGKPARAKKTKG